MQKCALVRKDRLAEAPGDSRAAGLRPHPFTFSNHSEQSRVVRRTRSSITCRCPLSSSVVGRHTGVIAPPYSLACPCLSVAGKGRFYHSLSYPQQLSPSIRLGPQTLETPRSFPDSIHLDRILLSFVRVRYFIRAATTRSRVRKCCKTLLPCRRKWYRR